MRRKQVTYSSRPNHAARAAHAKGDKQFRTYDTSAIVPKQSKVPMFVTLAVVVVLIVGIAFAIRGCMSKPVELIGPDQQVVVVVEEGESAKAIGDILVNEGLIESASSFTEAVNVQNAASALMPGTYTFTGGTPVEQIVQYLIAGPDSMATKITIPEGLTRVATAQAVQDATQGRVSADDFLAQTADASVYVQEFPFLESAGNNNLEGYLFPKTYTLNAQESTRDLVVKMLKQFGDETASLDWSYPESLGMSHYDAVKLASIVEKESSGDEAIRARVAAVFYNRLTTEGEPSNGYLQSDATSAYEVGHDPTPDEVHAETPYSTYTNQGLPPTPICSPDIACLQAVCAPDANTLGQDFFFYFDEEGNYTFSATYDEHMSAFS